MRPMNGSSYESASVSSLENRATILQRLLQSNAIERDREEVQVVAAVLQETLDRLAKRA